MNPYSCATLLSCFGQSNNDISRAKSFYTCCRWVQTKLVPVEKGSILYFDFCSYTLENCTLIINSVACVPAGSHQPKLPLLPKPSLMFSIPRCVHMCISTPVCSVQAPSTLICTSTLVALLDIQAQCCSLSQARPLYARLKLARNSWLTSRIV